MAFLAIRESDWAHIKAGALIRELDLPSPYTTRRVTDTTHGEMLHMDFNDISLVLCSKSGTKYMAACLMELLDTREELQTIGILKASTEVSLPKTY